MTRKSWFIFLGLMGLILVAGLAACGDDDDDDTGDDDASPGADEQEIADLLTRLVSMDGAALAGDDAEFFIAHVTDSFLQEFGTESVTACEADIETCIGEPLPNATVDATDVEIDGDNASVTIGSEIGNFGVIMINEDDTWKANRQFVPDDDIAEGTEVIDLEMIEFAFAADLDSDAVKSGDFAFKATNNGDQDHEIVLVALPAEGSLEELLQDDTFEPEPIFVKVPYHPGDESDVALPAPLDPGRYGLVCFLPDTDEEVAEGEEPTPHAFKGMVAEFTVE